MTIEQLTMPPAEVLYSIAARLKARAQAQERWIGSLGPQTMPDSLQTLGNGYLIANTQANQD